MKNVVFIHGAWSTGRSFAFVESHLIKHNTARKIYKHLYSIQNSSLQSIINEIDQYLINEITEPTVIVGHSLGGIIALGLHDNHHVESIVTVASPLAGLQLNRFLKALVGFRTPYLLDAFAHSGFMEELHKREYTKKINCLITDAGYSPFMYEKGDGVVSYASQTDWTPKNAELITLPYNHHEVLLSSELCDVVNNRLMNGYTARKVD